MARTKITGTGLGLPTADGAALGGASNEWSDLYLADSGVIYFGNDQDVTVTHDPDDGLFLKSTATADDNPFVLTLQTGETDIAANDVLGKIAFQAPDEGTGTDAILVASAIQAVSEGNFSSSSNATSLQFMTGSSAAATAKVYIDSAGHVGIGDSSPSDYYGNTNLVVTDTTSTEVAALTLRSATDGTGIICFADTNSGNARFAGHVQYQHATDMLTFGVGNSAEVRLTGAAMYPSSVDGTSLGLSTNEWSDLYLADGGVIYFGNDQDITITHNPDAGVTLGGTTPTLTIGDAGAEDTKIVFDGNAEDFHIGLDDSADDLVIGLGSALGTTTHMAFDATGAVTMPLQPAVLAVSATVSNVSGNGDAYTTANFETEIYDQNADFNNSNFTFTAPVTGRYSASITTHIGGCASDNTRASARIVASNRDIIIYDVHGYNVSQPDPKFVLSGHTLIDMDANDTLSVTFYAYNGSKVVDWLVNSSLSVNLVA